MSEKENGAEKRIDQLLNDVGHLSNQSTQRSENTAEEIKDVEQADDALEKDKGQSSDAQGTKDTDQNIDGDGDKASDGGQADEESQAKTEENKLVSSNESTQETGDGEPIPKSKKPLWITLGIVAAVIVILGGVYAFLSMPLSEAKKQDLFARGTFIEGVTIFDIDVGNDTMDIAREKLSSKVDFAPDQVLLELKLKDEVIPVKAGDLQIDNTMDMVMQEAMLFGREGHFAKKLMEKSNAKENGKNFDVSISTDMSSLNNLVTTIVEKYSIEPKDADVQLASGGGEKFTYTPEQAGLQIKADGLAEKIKEHVESGTSGYLDVDYEEITPNIIEEELRKNMVLRSAYTTSVSGATGRRKNVALSGQKINGKKVMPGENFNIEKELGPRTPQNGWNMGGEFVNGELVNGYGGGICQTSSTLFNAVIRADLQIVERSNHSQTVGYVPLGFDATISSGGPYFIWKNNTEFPIYIFAYGGTSSLTIELYGAPLSYGDNITFDTKSSASGTITSGRRVESALVFLKDGKEVHRISWSSSYRGKPVKVTTAKPTTAATTKAPVKPDTPKPTTAPSTKPTVAPPKTTATPPKTTVATPNS